MKTVQLNQIRTAEYFYVLYVKDSGGNPVPGIGVNFYKNIDYATQVKQFVCNNCGYVYGGNNAPESCPVCSHNEFNEIISSDSDSDYRVTDENGLICISLGELSTRPSNIYARCEFIPDEYNYVEQTLTCTVSPTLGENIPGGTIELISTTRMYYNFKVLDLYTNTPVGGATVTYDNINKQTDENGFSEYSSFRQSLNITITKEGYGQKNLGLYEGGNSSEYDEKKLVPNNAIKVINSNGSVPDGLKVKIINKGSFGDRWIGDYNVIKGYQGEYYVETLPTSIYTSGNRYLASIAGDEYTNVNKVYITSGVTTIDISSISEGEDNPDVEFFDDFNEMSISSIKEHINSGNNDLKKKGETSRISYHNTKKDKYDNDVNDYRIKILDPDTINVYDIFASTPVEMYNDQKSIIGSMDIELKEDINELRVKAINRYSGYYNPIFKDVLFYNDMSVKNGEKTIKCPFSNTSFDDEYKDNYGKFGIINNIWFHKVNDNRDIEIINTTEPYYPLTGQYALDCRDYNIFETNWDKGHYTKQIDVENSELCQNISSMKEGLCMFGSKYLNVPEWVEIYGVTLGDNPEWNGEWNGEWITQPEVCPGEIMYKEVNDNSVDFYIFLKKRIIRFFREMLNEEFAKYVSPEFSFGKDGLDDDIEEYVKKNILKLYKLEKVRLFIRRTKRGIHNSKIENDYTKYLEYDRTCESESEKTYFEKHNLVEYFRQHGFVEVNNIRLNKVNTDDFDRKVVYNLKNGVKEEFGFSFVLKKI